MRFMVRSAQSPVLLIDVGSDSVGVAIAHLENGGIPVLSGVRRIPFENTSGMNTEALPNVAIQALRKCFAEGIAITPIPQMAFVVLAAPWYQATASIINSFSEKPTRLTARSIEAALKTYTEKNEHASIAGRKTIEAAATEAYVDGYPTTTIGAVRGSALAIDYYESEADGSFLAAIEEELRRAFPGIATTFHSFLFVAFAALRALREETGFILLDVGGEITDLAIIRRGGFAFTGSFPYGTLSFLRTIAKEKSMADAASRATLFVRGELSQEEQQSFKKSFDDAAGKWESGYRQSLDTAALDIPLPRSTFLFADPEPLQWFNHVLSDAETPFPINPILVSPDFFKHALLLADGGSYDAFLSVAALYALKVKP